MLGNIQIAEVKPEFNSANISFGGYISSPFFPISYSDDLIFEQVINCKLLVCKIHLIFVDFQIAEGSAIEVCMPINCLLISSLDFILIFNFNFNI